MNKNKSKVVVILGMHRSGTSMVGGVLTRLGVTMGENFREDRIISNPLGFYEDIKFLNLNNDILREAGGSWENPPKLEQILYQRSKFENSIKKLVKEKPQLWGWKDPRTCLTIRLYLPYLINAYFIVCHREPESIANSLYKRSRMPRDKAIKLYEIYQEEIVNFFKDYPNLRKIDLNYNDVISNPKENINEIIDFLDIKVKSKQYQKAIEFVLPKVKRNKIKNRLLIKHLITRGIKSPWKIPRYLMKTIKKFLQN
ncbi:MAG: sulfotransferase family protein [Promethearchaeota archaeon]